MSDKELIQERIDELKESISSHKATGKTYRAINNAIEELFNKPIGSQIHLVDENTENDSAALKEFTKKFSQRMQRDFPDTYFKITYPAPGVAIAIRMTETYQEVAQKRLKQWQEKLNEIK